MTDRTLAGSRRDREASTLDAATDSIEDLRSLVTVSRTHPTDIGERQVFVRLDDQRVTLLYGECVTTELRPGSHVLRAHNTLVWKNVPFTIEAGEHIEFIIINSGRWWTWGVAGVFGSAPLFLTIEKRSRV